MRTYTNTYFGTERWMRQVPLICVSVTSESRHAEEPQKKHVNLYKYWRRVATNNVALSPTSRDIFLSLSHAGYVSQSDTISHKPIMSSCIITESIYAWMPHRVNV